MFFIWTLEKVGLQLKILQNIEKGQNLMKKLFTGKKINRLLPKLILSPLQSSLPFSQPTLPKWYSFWESIFLRDLWTPGTFVDVSTLFLSYKKFYGGQKVADALLETRQEKNLMLPVTEVQQMENLSTDILSINVWEQIFLPEFSISLIKGEEVKSKWSSEVFGQQSLLFFPHFLLVAWLGAGRTHTKSSFTYFLHFLRERDKMNLKMYIYTTKTWGIGRKCFLLKGRSYVQSVWNPSEQ